MNIFDFFQNFVIFLKVPFSKEIQGYAFKRLIQSPWKFFSVLCEILLKHISEIRNIPFIFQNYYFKLKDEKIIYLKKTTNSFHAKKKLFYSFYQFVNHFLKLLLCKINVLYIFNMVATFWRCLLYREVLKCWINQTFDWKCTCHTTESDECLFQFTEEIEFDLFILQFFKGLKIKIHNFLIILEPWANTSVKISQKCRM